MLTGEHNLFLAKKVFVELVYNAAYVEGSNVTFTQAQTIMDGIAVNDTAAFPGRNIREHPL